MIEYCNSCILPNTRPNILFDELGNCNAATIENKKSIDWNKREREFNRIVNHAKSKNGAYDCVIPVSGGKDSTWQVIKALEYDLRPLCVTWKTPVRTKLGEANLKNLISLGVNHIDFTIDPIIEKIFTYKAFKKFGSPVIPMHMALHAIPLQIAVNFKIPLILWGENSAYEYGGEEQYRGVRLNHEWLIKYGVTNGTTAKDWIDDDLSKESLSPYFWPSDKKQGKADVFAIFTGHYFNWDPIQTYEISKSYGFKAATNAKTGFYKFADIDDSFLITIHHWMKWYKFGFTRLWDNLSIEIRNDRMSRDEAIKIVREKGEELPEEEIKSFCNYLDIKESHFFEIVSKFRNRKIWGKNDSGVWYIENFLIDDWKWS
tara:strand:- start:3 stop:1121 length:1119 start_codon:yes stop_codon:yes gene_type:complete